MDTPYLALQLTYTQAITLKWRWNIFDTMARNRARRLDFDSFFLENTF